MITYDYILGLKENHNISSQLDHKQHFTLGISPRDIKTYVHTKTWPGRTSKRDSGTTHGLD